MAIVVLSTPLIWMRVCRFCLLSKSNISFFLLLYCENSSDLAAEEEEDVEEEEEEEEEEDDDADCKTSVMQHGLNYFC